MTRLRPTQPRNRSSIPGNGKSFFNLLRSLQSGSGVHPASCCVGTGTFLPRVKRQERQVARLPLSTGEVKKGWSCIYVVGSKSFRPDIQKPRQMENAVGDI